MGRIVEMRSYSSRPSAAATTIARIADQIVALVAHVSPAVHLSVSLSQTAGEILDAEPLRARLLSAVDVLLRVALVPPGSVPESKALRVEVALIRTVGTVSTIVAAWNAAVYVVPRRAHGPA